jgi:hypothetical protein
LFIVVARIGYESGIELNEQIVIITTKGEAVALAIAQMVSARAAAKKHSVVYHNTRTHTATTLANDM